MNLPAPPFAPAELIDPSLSTPYTRKPGDPALDASRPIQEWTPEGDMLAALQAGRSFPFNYIDTSSGTMRISQATATPAWLTPNCPNDGTESEPRWSNKEASPATSQQPGNPTVSPVNGLNLCLKSDAQGILLAALAASGLTGCLLVDRTGANNPNYQANGETRRQWEVWAEDGESLGNAAIRLAQMAVNGHVVPGTWVRDGSNLTWTPEPAGWVPPGETTVGRPCAALPAGYSFAVVNESGMPMEMVVGPASAKPTAQELAAQIIALAQQI